MYFSIRTRIENGRFNSLKIEESSSEKRWLWILNFKMKVSFMQINFFIFA